MSTEYKRPTVSDMTKMVAKFKWMQEKAEAIYNALEHFPCKCTETDTCHKCLIRAMAWQMAYKSDE